jgi:uncharacterized damage-inducible protein DinB
MISRETDPQPAIPNAGGEIELYLATLRQALDRLCERIDGLTAEQLNFHPPAPDANSIYVIATHLLGNAEAWVLGIACGHPVERDRPAEFRATGDSAQPLIETARSLNRRIEDAVRAIPEGALGEPREGPAHLWGAGLPRTVTVREALMHVVEHASNHLGHIDVTRDLALASTKS